MNFQVCYMNEELSQNHEDPIVFTEHSTKAEALAALEIFARIEVMVAEDKLIASQRQRSYFIVDSKGERYYS